MPEPAAIRASCTKPVTIKTGGCGDFLLAIAVIGDIAISRVIGQPIQISIETERPVDRS
jgi:hypothetical protein